MLSVTSKSAITPSFMGLIATMLAGVLPNIFLASFPTARIFLVPRASLLMATTDGSLDKIPLPFTKTKVEDVPRSIAKSLENNPKRLSNSMILSSSGKIKSITANNALIIRIRLAKARTQKHLSTNR